MFVPNGYLLYNFAGTFPVDFTFKQTKLFVICHMALVTAVFVLPVAFVMAYYNFGEVYENTQLETTVLSSDAVFYGLGSTILVLGLLSVLFCILHWRLSIRTLYYQQEENADCQQRQQVIDADENAANPS